jgi:hypothetical protein
MKQIATVKIHPAIGIARVGNSPTEFFIGPETAGAHRRPDGGYRDAQGRIKRQAARFRLFGYDKNGDLVQEITAKDATITWTVHLANKKAEWIKFQGPKSSTKNLRRNPTVTDRDSLVIDPGPRSLDGPESTGELRHGRLSGRSSAVGRHSHGQAGTVARSRRFWPFQVAASCPHRRR